MKQLNSENLKQIIAGLPKGLNINVNGMKCNSVKIGVDDDGVYFVDFITAQELVVTKEEALEHDGCEGCKHVDKDYNNYPCDICKQNYRDCWVMG